MGSLSGDFGRKWTLIYFRGNSLDVDIDYIRRGNRIFDVLCCDGPLRLHLAKQNSRFDIRWAPEHWRFGENQERDFTKQADDAGGRGYSVGPECLLRMRYTGEFPH